jgi:hypothetical protein
VALETQFLQAWLLQLTCLHASFHPTFEAWCTSTRKALRTKFADTAARMTLVSEREMQTRARLNIEALAAWCKSSPPATDSHSPPLSARDMSDNDWARLADNIQTLATVIRETTSLIEPSGRAAVAVGWFASWINGVERVWLRRQSTSTGLEEHDVEFVDQDMGSDWRTEAQSVLRRLSGLRRMLEGLPKPDAVSTVAHVMGSLDGLLRGAIEELETVVATEKVVMKLEREWVDGMLGDVLLS